MGSIRTRLEGAHGAVVKSAMTSGERRLTGVVLAVNLALVGWLFTQADFSDLRPNARGEEPAAQAEPAATIERGEVIAYEARSEP